MSEQDGDVGLEARLRRAEANARILADELARREGERRRSQAAGEQARREQASSEQTIARPERVVYQEAPQWSATPQAPGGSDQALRRIAVVCWDLGHNPAARAMVLAELLRREGTHVDLIGPLWSRYGGEVWPPLREQQPAPLAFKVHRLTDFLASAYGVAAHCQGYDLVVVSKPRLSGLIVGSLLQRANQCSLVLDIDEDELSFVDVDEPLLDVGPAELEALLDPTDSVGTALGVALEAGAPIRTVSNIALQNRFGGAIVRHSRDERQFAQDEGSRAAGRANLGAAPDDFVVLFMGTPRPHKGLQMVVDALRQLDDRFVLHVVGAPSRKSFDRDHDCEGARVVTHPLVEFSDVPIWLAGGDAIVLMQDPASHVSAFQIPAKIADGLSMGLPVIASNVPPFADISTRIVPRAGDATELAQLLLDLRESDTDLARVERRTLFGSEFSNAINRTRIEFVGEQADALPPAVHDDFASSVLTPATRAYVHHRAGSKRTGSPVRSGVDIVMFWKQNDTGIYGRRSDMLARYFARDQRVRSVLHFDAPVRTRRVFRNATDDVPATDHGPLLSRALLDRRLGIADDDNLFHRTMIYNDDPIVRRDPLTGLAFPGADGFAAFVAAEAKAVGVDPTEAIAWVWPAVLPFPEVHRSLGFRTVACDIIDDQRRFEKPVAEVEQLDAHYETMLGLCDHVFTNCRTNAETFAADGKTVHVVANGAETAAFDATHLPREDGTSVVAYVGNMRDRMDWPLIESIAEARPDYRFELVGSVPDDSDGHEVVRSHDNVTFRGVVDYVDLPGYLQTVDVCIVPHKQGALIETMNPLKMYNFYAAGVPIVSTPSASVEDLGAAVAVASDADEFTRAIDLGIERRRAGHVERDGDVLATIDWQSRASRILDILLES